MTTRIVIATLFALAALTGCSPGSPEYTADQQVPAAERDPSSKPPAEATDVAQTLVFVADDVLYDDAPTTARAGTLTIVMENVGAADHNVVFEGYNDEQPVAEASGGERDQGTITPSTSRASTSSTAASRATGPPAWTAC